MVLLHLKRGNWYGWTMWPGYVDQPYLSPVLAHSVAPLRSGAGLLDFTFYNLAYAQGVQDMCYRLKVMKREEKYLLAEQISEQGKATDRAVCIEPLTVSWMTRSFPETTISIADLFDGVGTPDSDRLIHAFSRWL